MSEDTHPDIVRKENSYGIMKDYIKVSIGTTVVEVPRHIRNPINEERCDLAKLSDDGYLKPFLATHYHTTHANVVDLDSSPIASFDKDKWELVEREQSYVVRKKEPETKFDEAVMESWDGE